MSFASLDDQAGLHGPGDLEALLEAPAAEPDPSPPSQTKRTPRLGQFMPPMRPSWRWQKRQVSGRRSATKTVVNFTDEGGRLVSMTFQTKRLSTSAYP